MPKVTSCSATIPLGQLNRKTINCAKVNDAESFPLSPIVAIKHLLRRNTPSRMPNDE